MIARLILPLALAAGLAACDAGPTETPAEPITPPPAGPPSAERTSPEAEPPVAKGEAGDPGFVGRWAADPAWCGNTIGAERPIRITASRFEGYENQCDVTALVRGADGWDATLACEAEGQQSTERVGFAVDGDTLTLTYRDREGGPVTFTRCAGLAPRR